MFVYVESARTREFEVGVKQGCCSSAAVIEREEGNILASGNLRREQAKQTYKTNAYRVENPK